MALPRNLVHPLRHPTSTHRHVPPQAPVPIPRIAKRLFGFLLLLAFAQAARAVQPVCSLRQPPLRVKRANLFTSQQEQWLGDAQADMVEPLYTLLPTSQSAYLDEIGQRLLAQLPPTPIHYTFRVYESPDLRAFSLAGGHIYISRKLIMDARSEDELAAMLAQEIGRVYIHHSASAVTRRLRRLLHVKALGDRADVYDKFERMLNVPPDPFTYLSQDEQQSDELLADRVGIYAMIKANYNPKAFPTFLDRVNDNGGYAGNLITDAFDITPLISIRVREAHKIVASLPGSCRNPRPLYRPGFQPFQQQMEQRIDPIVPPTPGLVSVSLPQPMNPALENVVLSPDGKYVLAQDPYQIHVLSTSPLKFRFSVDALGAQMAQFTPDSKSLVYHYNDLHVERWQLATGQPTDVQDFVDYAGCVQTSLSPDGNVMACVSYNEIGDSVWLKLVDIHAGQILYQNLHFFDEYGSLGNSNAHITPNFQALMHWSRDGRYFVAASGTSAMAYDLRNHTTVHLGGDLANLSQERFSFIGSDKLLSTCDWGYKTGAIGETYRMCETTFPAGQTLSRFQLPIGWIASVAGGDHILFGPVNHAAAVLLNPANGKVQNEFRNETVDILGDTLAAEMPDGGIGVGPQHGALQKIPVPGNPLSAVEASAFSMNGRYLAVSDRARGAEWDLATGKRIALTGPFRVAAVSDSGQLQALPVSHELKPSIDPNLDKLTHKYDPIASPLDDPLQYGTIRLRFKPIGPVTAVANSVDMQAYDATTEARLWTRPFLFSVPQIVPADGDQMLFIADRLSATGNDEASQRDTKWVHTSDLTRQFLYPQGVLVEALSNRTGKVVHAIVAPQYLGSSADQRTAGLFGSYFAVYGNRNNTTVYDVRNGTRLLAFFGRALAGDDSLHMIAATNRPQELNLYDCATGKLLAHYLLDQSLLNARFLPARKELLVLTASQRVYHIDLARLVTEQP